MMNLGNCIMRNSIFAASALIAGVAIAAAPSFVLDEQPATAQQVAAYLASLEQPIQKGDLKGYCAAVLDRPAAVQMTTRMCQDGVKKKQNKPEDCTEARIKQHMKKEMDSCLAMPADEFAKVRKDFPAIRSDFVKKAKAQGLDGEKLIVEERAKLK